MQYAVLALMLTGTAAGCRRIHTLREKGKNRMAMGMYRRLALLLGSVIWGAMAVQEAVLWRSGLLTPATGLPLHLCSLMGLLTLPMLLTRSPVLWHMSVYAGVPGALLALVFPAVPDTSWPMAAALSFFVLHAGLISAPLLPAVLGLRLRSSGALTTWVLLLCAAVAAMLINGATGGNYLFLAGPVPGTPLMLLAEGGEHAYRLRLAALASLVLALEGSAVCAAENIWKRKHPKSSFL